MKKVEVEESKDEKMMRNRGNQININMGNV